jgi:hypothetical protein
VGERLKRILTDFVSYANESMGREGHSSTEIAQGNTKKKKEPRKGRKVRKKKSKTEDRNRVRRSWPLKLEILARREDFEASPRC